MMCRTMPKVSYFKTYIVLYCSKAKFSLVLKGKREGRLLYFNIEDLLELPSQLLLLACLFLYIIKHLL